MNTDKHILDRLDKLEFEFHSNRRSFAINQRHLSQQLDEIKRLLFQKNADEETAVLQYILIKERLENHMKDERKVNHTFSMYKNKMKYWEIFQEWNHIPFWTFMALFCFVVRRELILLYNSLIFKFLNP